MNNKESIIIEKVKKETEPKRRMFYNMFKAFLVGGFICLIAEIIRYFLLNQYTSDDAGNITILIMIFLAALLTAFGIYDRIGQFAGCGTIIPITGFANSMSSSAIESKTEGVVVGVLNNVFKLAGSVITTAVVCGVILGLVRYIGGIIFG